MITKRRQLNTNTRSCDYLQYVHKITENLHRTNKSHVERYYSN